jgi:hypothetical protein
MTALQCGTPPRPEKKSNVPCIINSNSVTMIWIMYVKIGNGQTEYNGVKYTYVNSIDEVTEGTLTCTVNGQMHGRKDYMISPGTVLMGKFVKEVNIPHVENGIPQVVPDGQSWKCAFPFGVIAEVNPMVNVNGPNSYTLMVRRWSATVRGPLAEYTTYPTQEMLMDPELSLSKKTNRCHKKTDLSKWLTGTKGCSASQAPCESFSKLAEDDMDPDVVEYYHSLLWEVAVMTVQE